MTNNLPPGVSESDLPGSRPEDLEHDAVMDWVEDQLVPLSPDDIRLVLTIGLAAVENTKELIDQRIVEARKDERLSSSAMLDEALNSGDGTYRP